MIIFFIRAITATLTFKRLYLKKTWDCKQTGLTLFHSSGNATTWKTKILQFWQADGGLKVLWSDYYEKTVFTVILLIRHWTFLHRMSDKDSIPACQHETVQPLIKPNWLRRVVLNLELDYPLFLYLISNPFRIHYSYIKTRHFKENIIDN